MFPTRSITQLFIYLAIAAALLGAPTSGQALSGAFSSSKSPSENSTPIDPLNRSTPRNSIYSFLDACHDDNFLRAAQYLDLRRIRPEQRTTQGPQLAKQLGLLLDRETRFEVGRLNN